jgi:peptidoglycan/LPS O-acetylase OafA/YrhL
LRAIAVGLVLLHHFTLTKFASGGFVGVDVFFVISGYLITATLENDLRSGLTGIGAFYRRRILRIFPALFVVMLACWVTEILVHLPHAVLDFKRAFLTAIFFVSNFDFWKGAGYFDFASRDNALLHTWSLSVEEQFYLLLPLLLLLMRRLSRTGRNALLALSCLASLAAAQVVLDIDSGASFYLVPFRIWELLIGSALSLKVFPRIANYWLGEALSLAGIGLILGAALLLQHSSPFPGLRALAPVLGTGMILMGTEQGQTRVGRLLSLPPMRLIGLCSYSLYLWHWPIFVYSKYFLASDSRGTKVALILLSVAVALASWRFIEQPFRRAGRRFATPRVLKTGAGAMAAMVVIALLTVPISNRRWPPNASAEAALATLKADNESIYGSGVCFDHRSDVLTHLADCLRPSGVKPNVLILGDSHAAQLRHGYGLRYPGVNFLQATLSSCTPVNSFGDPICTRYMAQLIDDILPRLRPDMIVLSGRWQSANDAAGVKSVAEHLAGLAKQVVVIGPFPEYSLPFAEVVARARYANDPSLVEFYRKPKSRPLDDLMSGLFVDTPAIHYISPVKAMCPERCTVNDDQGRLLMWDNDHLTPGGSIYFAEHAPLPGLPVSPEAPSVPARP